MSQTGEALESPRQLATRLGWPLARVRKLIRTKQLRHVKIGGLYFVPRGAVVSVRGRGVISAPSSV